MQSGGWQSLVSWLAAPAAQSCMGLGKHGLTHWDPRSTGLANELIDLRTAQVYCDPFFLVSQEVFLNFQQFLWVKLWVGWVGRGYTEISRYFPASRINWVTLVTKINFCIHWDFRSPLNHQKCLYGMLFCVSKPDSICAVYHSFPSSFSDWLIIYPRIYRLQHSPNLVDVGL